MKTILDLVKANTELNSLSNKLDESTQRNKDLSEQLEAQAAQSAEENAKLGAEHSEEISALESKIALLEEANTLLEQDKQSSAEQAADIAASLGVTEPVEEAIETEPKEELSVSAHWEHYQTRGSREDKRAYYLKHIKPLQA
ncbi:hypothetical protein HN801_00725 [Candidatus Peregrinibacteria bacterium]|jgi:hypothetical protein|nr:hypothetical protein [Candidatus Peregrinibacteria bacterium]